MIESIFVFILECPFEFMGLMLAMGALVALRPIERISNAFYIARIYQSAGMTMRPRHGFMVRAAYAFLNK